MQRRRPDGNAATYSAAYGDAATHSHNRPTDFAAYGDGNDATRSHNRHTDSAAYGDGDDASHNRPTDSATYGDAATPIWAGCDS